MDNDIDPTKLDLKDDILKTINIPSDLGDFLVDKKNWAYFRTLMAQHISYDDCDRIEGVEHQLYHLVEDIRKLTEEIKSKSVNDFIKIRDEWINFNLIAEIAVSPIDYNDKSQGFYICYWLNTSKYDEPIDLFGGSWPTQEAAQKFLDDFMNKL